MTGVAKESYHLGARLPGNLIFTISTTTTTPASTASFTNDLAGHAHLTSQVAGSAKSRDEVMDVVVAKIISLLVLTVLSVLCGLLPLRLLIHTPHIFSKNRKPVDSFLCGLRLFSGGIYLATCFLHLLPDTRVKMAAVMVNMGSRSTYAIPELLVISGFYAVVFMEQIIKTLYIRAEISDTRRKKRPRRRKMREVYKSTLDDRDDRQSGDRFELTDEYTSNTRNMYDDDCDMKAVDDDEDDDDDDDDDDENNVLVEDEDDDDEFIGGSDMESERSSQNSYTNVKKGIDDKDCVSADFQEETLPRIHSLYQNQTKVGPCPYKEILQPSSRDGSKEIPVTSSIVSVHRTAPNMTSSPAILLSTIASCANKQATTKTFTPSSVPSSTPSHFTSTQTDSNTNKISSSEPPNKGESAVHSTSGNFKPVPSSLSSSLSSSPSSAVAHKQPSSTTHIFPSICNVNGCDNDEIDSSKQKLSLSPTHNAKIPIRVCHYQESQQNIALIRHQQPYFKDAWNDSVVEEISRKQKHIYPNCTDTSSHKEIQLLPHTTQQHPRSTEPSVHYTGDDKIRIRENHIDDESIVPPSAFVDRENSKSTFDSPRDKDNDSGIFSSKREGEEKFLEERRRLMMTSSENSIDKISECACSMHEFQVQQVMDELKHPEVSTSAHLRSIIYILALAFHGIFEGMALGLQSMKNSVWALCFAIVVHRCVLAFKLGMDLCRGEEKQGTSFLCIGTFTLISALGIIIGILISSGASFYSDVSVPEAILQSLATGTIIYIVFLDILIKDLQGKDDLKRVSCTFVGFSLMAVVFAVASS